MHRRNHAVRTAARVFRDRLKKNSLVGESTARGVIMVGKVLEDGQIQIGDEIAN